MRKFRFLCCLVFLVQIVTWLPATSRLLAPNQDHPAQQLDTVTTIESSQPPYSLIQDPKGKEEIPEEASYREMVNRLGSRPPNCDHKCGGCMPCVAIEVPTITGHLGIQYANYEPESWKCKCGPSFYSP